MNTRIDATHILAVGGITPDGKTLLGVEYTMASANVVDQNAPVQAGFMDIATRRFTAIGVSGSFPYGPGCCDTDGRFLIATQDTAPQATCGICHIAYWSYDLVMGRKYLVNPAGGANVVEGYSLNHGLLIMWAGGSARLANLATHTVSSFPGLPSFAQFDAFSSPYLLYSVPAGANVFHAHVRNITTGQDIALPQLDALDDISSNTTLISGDTLFVVNAIPGLPVSGTPAGGPTPTTLYELDAIMNPGSVLKPIANYQDTLAMPEANTRLILFLDVGAGSFVWDRAEHRFVTLPGRFSYAGNYLISDTLATARQGSVPSTVTLYDTVALPTLAGG